MECNYIFNELEGIYIWKRDKAYHSYWFDIAWGAASRIWNTCIKTALVEGKLREGMNESVLGGFGSTTFMRCSLKMYHQIRNEQYREIKENTYLTNCPRDIFVSRYFFTTSRDNGYYDIYIERLAKPNLNTGGPDLYAISSPFFFRLWCGGNGMECSVIQVLSSSVWRRSKRFEFSITVGGSQDAGLESWDKSDVSIWPIDAALLAEASPDTRGGPAEVFKSWWW